MVKRISFVFAMVLTTGCFFFNFAQDSWQYEGHCVIEQISIRNEGSIFHPDSGFQIKVRFTKLEEGDNLKAGHLNKATFLTVRTAVFGTHGIKRILALLTSALNNNNYFRIRYNDPTIVHSEIGGDLHSVFIQR